MNKMCVCVCVCVKGEHNVYPNQHMAIIPNTKIKKIKYTHTIILNIKKKIKTHTQKKMRKKKYEEKPHQFCTSK